MGLGIRVGGRSGDLATSDRNNRYPCGIAQDDDTSIPGKLDSRAMAVHNLRMNPVLQTKRLTLTPIEPADVDLAIEMFTDPEVLRYAGGAMKVEDIIEHMAPWCRRGGNGCIGIWRVSHRESGEKLGSAALLPIPIDEDDTDYDLVVPDRMPDGDVEVGYFLKPGAWGLGYATEVCKRLLRMAFEDSPLTEVVATFEQGNTASRNVLEKSGFVDCGTRRCYGETGLDFRLTRERWLTLQRSP